jgi:hypothetical protein
MKNFWILAAALVLVLGIAGYTLAQSAGPQGGMMGHGMGMGGGTMGQGGMVGQGNMMSGGMMSMMSGQPLTQEQLEQFAKQHGITVEQAKQMTDTCGQIMSNAKANQPKAQ